MLEQLDDPAAALDAAVLAGVVVEAGSRLVRRPPADRRRGGGVAAAGPPRADLPAAGRRPRPIPSGARTSPRWPPGPGRTARSPKRWTRPRPPRTPAPPTPPPRQFAAQAVLFTPEPDAAALVRRRIRAGELLFLAGDIETVARAAGGARHRRAGDRGPGASAAAAARHDRPGARRGRRHRDRHPRRRRRRRRSPAASAGAGAGLRRGLRHPRRPPGRRRSRRSAAPRPPARRPPRRCTAPCSTWSWPRSPRREGLDTELLDRAAEPGGGACRRSRLHDTRRPAPRAVVPVHRGPGHRAGRAAAVHRPRQGGGRRLRAVDVPVLPGGDRGAGRRLRGRRGGHGRGGRGQPPGTTGRRPPGISSRAASC